MIYILDINRYYLEVALNKIKLSKDTIVTNQILVLKKIIFDCVDTTVETVKRNDCGNVEKLYKDIVVNLRKMLPDFQFIPMIAISVEIKNPDQFKQSFKQLISDRPKMYERIVKCKTVFNMKATESCKDLIKTRRGCQAKCPGCRAKCDNTENNHKNHHSSHHSMKAFTGWCTSITMEPALDLCYRTWLGCPVITKKEQFISERDYCLNHSPEWFDDLELKSTTSYFRNDCIAPLEQRRAWMAVRNAVIKCHSSKGLKDLKYYDKQIYPDIQSVDANFTPVWN